MKQTALHDVHAELGAKLIDFGGWHMPVQYGPILEEVACVRQQVGLFDLGHMGRVRVSGPQAVEYMDRICTNYCGRIPANSIRYSLFCREDGSPIDDLLVYREPEAIYTVVNASNTAADLAWMREHAAGFEVEIDDQTERTGMVALQGEASERTLQALTEGTDLSELGYYKFTFGEVCGIPNTRISRTGYTGEDGFEVYFDNENAGLVWRSLMEAGEPHGLKPIGLGARDILRLEAGMALYGHEIDPQHNPIEAGLKFAISFHADKTDTIGRAALQAIHEAPKQRLVGVTTPGPRVPRQGGELYAGDERVGYVCSGAPSPTLETNIASVYVRIGFDEPGRELELDFRGKRQPCTVRELPFYSRTRK